jgi:hypothetical protein
MRILRFTYEPGYAEKKVAKWERKEAGQGTIDDKAQP